MGFKDLFMARKDSLGSDITLVSTYSTVRVWRDRRQKQWTESRISLHRYFGNLGQESFFLEKTNLNFRVVHDRHDRLGPPAVARGRLDSCRGCRGRRSVGRDQLLPLVVHLLVLLREVVVVVPGRRGQVVAVGVVAVVVLLLSLLLLLLLLLLL